MGDFVDKLQSFVEDYGVYVAQFFMIEGAGEPAKLLESQTFPQPHGGLVRGNHEVELHELEPHGLRPG